MDLKKDFSELEGKKVDIYSGGEFKEVGVVAGCEYDIGITLLKEGGSKDDHIYCSRGPSAPGFQGGHDAVLHHAVKFYTLAGMIKEGVIDFKVYYDLDKVLFTKSELFGREIARMLCVQRIGCSFTQ